MTKCYKMIGIIKRLSVNNPRGALLMIDKSFIRLHFLYRATIYDKPNNEPFKNKIEQIQYNACFTITALIQGTSCECLYQQPGLESIEDRGWYRKLIFFIKL